MTAWSSTATPPSGSRPHRLHSRARCGRPLPTRSSWRRRASRRRRGSSRAGRPKRFRRPGPPPPWLPLCGAGAGGPGCATWPTGSSRRDPARRPSRPSMGPPGRAHQPRVSGAAWPIRCGETVTVAKAPPRDLGPRADRPPGGRRRVGAASARLARRLGDVESPVAARGVALATLLVTDAASPLYRGGAAGMTLHRRLTQILFELETRCVSDERRRSRPAHGRLHGGHVRRDRGIRAALMAGSRRLRSGRLDPALHLPLLRAVSRGEPVMTMIPSQGTAQIVFYVLVLLALTPLLGSYMARVYEGEHVLLARWFGFAERGFYRLLRTSPDEEQDWKGYGHERPRVQPALPDPAVPAPARAGAPAAQSRPPHRRERRRLREHRRRASSPTRTGSTTAASTP